MTETEKIFLGALYALYFYESVFWIATGERAWVRQSAGWSLREVGPKSFTLLKRMPVWGDLLLLRPGIVRTSQTPPGKADVRALAKIAKRLDKMFALVTLCRMQAITLLVYVPILLLTHRLVHLWPIALGLVVLLHVGVVVFAAMAVWETRKRAAVLGAVAVNPMGAIRVMDAVAQALWDERVG